MEATMRTKDFIALCIKRHITLSDKRLTFERKNMMKGELQWWDYRRFADLTELLDYGCKFTELGCKKYRMSGWEKKQAMERLVLNEDGPYFSSRLMCCCRGCRGTVGWLRNLPNDYYILKQIAGYFSEKTGFWRADEGCVLPRKYRSPTCLRHYCTEIKPAKTARRLLKYLTMSDSQIQHDYYKITKKRPGNVSFIYKKFKQEMEEEIKNANSTDSNGA